MNIDQTTAEKYIGKLKFCTKEEAIAYATKATHGKKNAYLKLWIPVLMREDVTPAEVISELEKLPRDYDVRKAAFSRPDVQEYFQSTLSVTDAVALLQNTEVDDLSEGLLKREDVISYLKTLPSEEAIKFADTAKKMGVWGIVISRLDIPPATLLPYIVKKEGWWYWEKLIKRTDVQPADAIKYAKQADSETVWRSVLEKKDVQDYLA